MFHLQRFADRNIWLQWTTLQGQHSLVRICLEKSNLTVNYSSMVVSLNTRATNKITKPPRFKLFAVQKKVLNTMQFYEMTERYFWINCVDFWFNIKPWGGNNTGQTNKTQYRCELMNKLFNWIQCWQIKTFLKTKNFTKQTHDTIFIFW